MSHHTQRALGHELIRLGLPLHKDVTHEVLRHAQRNHGHAVEVTPDAQQELIFVAPPVVTPVVEEVVTLAPEATPVVEQPKVEEPVVETPVVEAPVEETKEEAPVVDEPAASADDKPKKKGGKKSLAPDAE